MGNTWLNVSEVRFHIAENWGKLEEIPVQGIVKNGKNPLQSPLSLLKHVNSLAAQSP